MYDRIDTRTIVAVATAAYALYKGPDRASMFARTLSQAILDGEQVMAEHSEKNYQARKTRECDEERREADAA